jgi:hypothetical protein
MIILAHTAKLPVKITIEITAMAKPQERNNDSLQQPPRHYPLIPPLFILLEESRIPSSPK